MTRVLSSMVLTLLLAGVVAAQTASADHAGMATGGMSVGGGEIHLILDGYLVDTACATAHKSDLARMAAAHETTCSVKDADGGLGIVSGGKWYAFDAKGSKKATEMLKKAHAEKGLTVSVTGTMHAGVITVSSIKETKGLQ